jgi:DNA-binding winged helix-turn-helix (wHTH) protein
MKIGILSDNIIFAEDLAGQISQYLKDSIVLINELQSDEDVIFVDEKAEAVQEIKDIPIVLFLSEEKPINNADLIVKKPFKLEPMLIALKNNTLLPKVRRKECLTFKEYSLYPVKKEIVSDITGIATKLTEKEVDIIKYLYQTAPVTASKEDLLKNVWEYSTDATTHTVETHIYRVRQKVEKNGKNQLIITENNGYRLNI